MSLDLQLFKKPKFTEPEPTIISEEQLKLRRELLSSSSDEQDNSKVITKQIFESIRSIRDPERPYTLEQLEIVSAEGISVT
mmetsp:Transcript_23044/g.20006  ORF Transcript_23044/g.20006 Transcript_23044/m.20006 type:complete len:81 (-) Transcript_23044:621-863(-)|eukprot:CAMPEP_0114579810 /NCGR_PEP_ID=MMETSP0125-20121206/4167_1 /TAXON_ID=485358 ORGANISM="Aristerostoma sp., Strain ATCC 50986" /NCGR_SAMPLE_ID=MMETSP0125 /ASSEMBLY_ACC=CAM_ASM_000245 /LENGTH=80 /DNA_ID=CAMNT_0001770887 /DNA_START=44 /DNA_END=286 /DNA_ORIENTATION=-